MAKLPPTKDPTLEAVDKALERGQTMRHRPYLGMSQLGHACRRMLWYSFRWATLPKFSAEVIKRFEDGHHGESLQASRLRLVDGLQLWTVDPGTGRQFELVDIGGHLKGHADGVVLGLLQAPKTPHVWEHKQTDDAKQRKLDKLKQEKGEKQTLADWDPVYYTQAQLYMHYLELNRHYLTVSTPGGRHTASCRTEIDPMLAKQAIKKAEAVITAQEPLERVNEDPDYYLCKWCGHHSICHGKRLPMVSCRTCAHATPETDGNGRWICAYWQSDIPLEVQQKGCEQHRYIPALLGNIAQCVDADKEQNWLEYQAGEFVFRNGSPGTDDKMPTLESLELWAAAANGDLVNIINDEFLQEIRKKFGARITDSETFLEEEANA